MASYPAAFSLQYRDTLLNVTLLESLLYGMYTTVVAFTIWVVAVRDKGRDRLIHGGLVLAMHLIATSHLAVRWDFIRGGFIRHGQTEETTYDYFFDAPKWMLLSTAAFMANTLIADCIMIWRCWIICGRKWMFVVVPGLCTIVGTIFAGFSIYQQTATPPPGSAWSTAQIDWLLPYFSMSLAVTLLCTLLIIYRITAVRPSIKKETRWLWSIEAIIESAALYAIALIILLAFYATNDVHTNYPIVVATIITVSFALALSLSSPGLMDVLSLGPGAYADRCSGISIGRCDDDEEDAGIVLILVLAYVSAVFLGILLSKERFHRV
ncbi:uncharacterized protein BT62DRAFT_54108 [Guyanagaster necrorhizus]|uniref:Uncharacterized protein n=1 Tax=Guyanagaster necrorhizus TaxID=856835 RepID=A0A9P7W6V0_9AGAR|nr:uncharacterized protein BT62DRAFT_54108 [Guyanagaster necrorhizus MCA 3950]KAG7453252.1 hypothetical protein BT62DRAFT_54108 [Guyanagaster necrorhizus MCA 3950]